jgi:hypothetical protein
LREQDFVGHLNRLKPPADAGVLRFQCSKLLVFVLEVRRLSLAHSEGSSKRSKCDGGQPLHVLGGIHRRRCRAGKIGLELLRRPGARIAKPARLAHRPTEAVQESELRLPESGLTAGSILLLQVGGARLLRQLIVLTTVRLRIANDDRTTTRATELCPRIRNYNEQNGGD